MRSPFLDVVFYLSEHFFVCVKTITVVVDIALLAFAGPWLSGDHIEVSFCGLFEFLIFFECMFFEAIVAPGEQIEHVGVFLSVFCGLAEDVLREEDATWRFCGGFFAGWVLHLEILIDFFYIKI